MKINEVIGQSGETESGTYQVVGSEVQVNNSGYREAFKLSDIAHGLAQGKFLPANVLADMQEEGVPADEIMDHAWEVSAEGDMVTIENGDVMYIIPRSILPV